MSIKCLAYDPTDLKTCMLAPCPEGHVNVLHPDNTVSCVKLPDTCYTETGSSLCETVSPSTCLLYKGVPSATNKVCLIDETMVSCAVGEVPVLEIMKATGHARVVCRRPLEGTEHPSTAAHLGDIQADVQDPGPPQPAFVFSRPQVFVVEHHVMVSDDDDEEEDDEDELNDELDDMANDGEEEDEDLTDRVIVIAAQASSTTTTVDHDLARLASASSSSDSTNMIYYGGPMGE